jgi:exodeoxyribonuclease VII large subunit
MSDTSPESERKIWQVTDLNRSIKSLLEDRYAFIWITGEISDFRIPLSGHCYFLLKDGSSQVSAIMFKGQRRNLRFSLENGMKVLGFGRVSVYEPKGTYQVILEYLEPDGIGSQLLLFEQVKKRLADEGLFDASHKKPIPFLPRNICLITSPKGAAIHDFLKVAAHRFPNMIVEIIPVRVQGSGAEREIASAIELMNRLGRSDVGVLTRGGGSAEDLAAFNTEIVARAIYSSNIPIVSAIGHEIDVTIADFTADLRAPTPSAAAEMGIPKKCDLLEKILQMRSLLTKNMERRLIKCRDGMVDKKRRLSDPTRKIQEWRLRLDDLQIRLIQFTGNLIRVQRERLRWRLRGLAGYAPSSRIQLIKEKLYDNKQKLLNSLNKIVVQRRGVCRDRNRMLVSLGPLNILARGYSITKLAAGGRILTDATTVAENASIEVILHRGILDARVSRIRQKDEKNSTGI